MGLRGCVRFRGLSLAGQSDSMIQGQDGISIFGGLAPFRELWSSCRQNN